jgi:hypothetical protein
MRLLITFFAFLLSATLYGQNDYSMSFDGVGDHVNCGQDVSLDLPASFTMSAMINIFSTTPYSHPIINTGISDVGCGSYDFGISQDLKVCVGANEGGTGGGHPYCNTPNKFIFKSSSNILVNQPTYVTAVYDGSEVSIYIDGNLDVAYQTILVDPYTLAYDLWIGAENGYYNALNGNIDDVQIWNTDLTQQEIQQYMSCPPTGNEEGLVGYWNFEEGSGTTAFDQTDNGNNGTINGATWSTDVPEQNCQSGCTDSLANNFNPEATLDDGTCCYVNITQNDTTICEGSSISLNVTGDLQNGLVAYYPFNGNANDESGNGNNGTVHEATLTSDRFGNSSSAYTFGGDGDYINIGNDESLNRENSSFSINTWINFNNYLSTSFPNQAAAIMSNRPSANNYGTLFALVHHGKLEIGTGGAEESARTPELLSTNQWLNVCVTHDNTTHITNFYIDGVFVYTTTSYDNSIVNVASGDHYIGKETHENLYPFDGEIDDMYLYNRVLTLEEVQELYNNSSGLISSIIWSTGDTTATITVIPTQTTTYWVEQTENGVTCTDEVTITVQSTGCGNSDACNFTEGDACDIDCVFALFENDCNTGAVACGEGTVWDSETQECIVANPTDTNFDGCTDLNDLLDILSAYGDCAMVETNYSLSFDGVDDYVVVDPFIRNASSDLTINVHAKGKGTMTCPKTPEYESYFGYVNDENGNRIYFHLGIFTSQSGHEWNVGEDLSTEYQFYTITLDDLGNGSTLAELFLNGVSLGQHTYPYSIPSYSYMEIGRNIVEGNGLYDGVISEIHMWDGLLTEQQIQSYMSTPPIGNEEGLVGYWDFNEGTGSTLTDQTSNGNDGIINGATWSTDVPTAP